MFLAVPTEFDFLSTVQSHGWSNLAPFRVDEQRLSLKYVYALTPGRGIVVEVTPSLKSGLTIGVDDTRAIGVGQKKEILSAMRSCFRLDEELSTFYSESRRHPEFRWIPKRGAGRLLRAPTVFEDVVKMICTTNCSWALTNIIVDNLCRKFGYRVSDKAFTFPTPEAIASSSEKALRRELRAGYRAPYLLELSRRIVKGELNVELWREATCSTEELYKEVQSVKGIGPYAAGNILKLLGRYDYLAIDSWCRKQFFEIHPDGRSRKDQAIEKFYEHYGKWRGLFFWMDLTKNWHPANQGKN